MAKKTVTVCHCLKIIPTLHIIRFAQIGPRTIMTFYKSEIQDPEVVPGTVLMATEIEDGIYSRSIDFEITEVNADTSEILSLLKTQRLVATYKDESGNDRVCGSPDYPLSLDYLDEDGVFKVSLTGKSNTPDGFLTF